MNGSRTNRVAAVAFLAIVAGIPAVILGYQFGIRPALADHRVIDITARTPEAGGFSPDLIRLEVGETVTLRFSADDVTHGVAVGPGLGIDLGHIDPGHVGETTVTFDSPGIYTYYCNTWCSIDHWRMRGLIEVVDGNSPLPEPPDDPIIDQLTAAGVDIDAEPRTAGVTPDREQGAVNVDRLEIPEDIADPDLRLHNSPSSGFDLLRAANPTIPDDLLIDAVAYLWSQAEPDAATVELYAKNCAACHGESGAGDGPAAGTSLETPVSFGDAAWLRSGDIWYAKIRRGGMGTDMPNFGTLFTVEETRDLVDYLWYLSFK